VEISIYLLLVAVSYLGKTGTSMHQIAFSHIVYRGDRISLTYCSESHTQKEQNKQNCLGFVIFYWQRSARDQLVS